MNYRKGEFQMAKRIDDKKRDEAFSMLLEGNTQQEVADRLGMSQSEVSRIKSEKLCERRFQEQGIELLSTKIELADTKMELADTKLKLANVTLELANTKFALAYVVQQVQQNTSLNTRLM